MQDIDERIPYQRIFDLLAEHAPAFPTERRRKNHLARILDRLKAVCTAPDIARFVVSVEWTRGGVYGSQAIATFTTDNIGRTGEKTGGCGYDKESTAIADVLNKSPEVLKLFFRRLESGLQSGEIDTERMRESTELVFGYGVGLFSSPDEFFDGGVGTNCYLRNFEAVGWTAEKIATGNLFDVWEFKKKGDQEK